MHSKRLQFDCEGCGREMYHRVPVNALLHNSEGLRLRCGQCRLTNWIGHRKLEASAEVAA